ncbi:MAG TPA: hypothetical protein P5060_01135 [Candidatus Absconditabacterales bacterium]|nr:hypothetical protein [Candidatus Absconditabacterales bacterium]
MNKKIKKFKWYDISIFKICVLAFAFMIATLIPAIINLDREIYAIVFVVSYIYLIWKIFKK